MANLRELRSRIASIRSTRKITSAMKMVAASRLRQAQEAVTESGYFAASLGRIIIRLAKTIDFMRGDDIAAGKKPRVHIPKLLVGSGNEQNHLIIVFSSSRGLCGGFNINVVKKTVQLINYLESEKKTVRLFCVGVRAYDMLKGQYGDRIIGTYAGSNNAHEQRHDAEKMSMRILDMYEAGEIDACSVIYNQFHSAISQEVRINPLVPLEPLRILQPFTGETPWGFKGNEDEYKIERPRRQVQGGAFAGAASAASAIRGQTGKSAARFASSKGPSPSQYKTTRMTRVLNSEAEEVLHVKDPLEYDFEPGNPEIMLRAMLPELLTTLIYRSTLESAASENGARMTAMDNATNNAGDIIDSLTLMYNRTRQALITKELTEIISGAEAL